MGYYFKYTKMLKIESTLALLVLVCGVGAIYGQACQRNELYYNATIAPICDRNCQDLGRLCRLTTTSAFAGCYCRPGHARDFQQRCVPTNQCGVMDCPPNELSIHPRRFLCEVNCRRLATPFPAFRCFRVTQRRCVCQANHCRNRSGRCEPILRLGRK